MPFTAADIRELAYDPQAYMRRRQRLASGGGFGVPDLWWRYGAAEAFHCGDRSLEAVDAYLGEVLARGCGPTQWKREKANVIRSQLADAYAPRDRVSALDFLDVVDTRKPAPVAWRGHQITVPGGLILASGRQRIARLLWYETRLAFRRPGVRLLVAATLASLETRLPEPPDAIEVCHLRDRDWSVYSGSALRAEWARLDALMTWAEHRPLMPPDA